MKRQREAMREARAGMRASSRSRVRLGGAALAGGAASLLFLALLPGPERRVYAGSTPVASQSPNDEQEYASPLEILLSPDGARLYVLCQQSADVRVLDAGSYKVIGTVAVGRVPRGMA